MRIPKNTVRNTHGEARSQFGVPVSAYTPGEVIQARGQAEFNASEVLPTNIQDPGYAERGTGRKLLETWGFTFGKPVHNDTIFTQAKLPPNHRGPL